MAIAHDTATVATAYTSTGTQTTSHSGSASTKAVVVLIDQNGTSADEVSGVTYGGTAMTRLDRNSEATEAGCTYTYYLLNPPTGTQDVAMTTTAATNKQLVCATMTGSPYKAIRVAGFSFGTSAGASNPAWTISSLPTVTKLEAYEVIHSGLTTMTNTPAASWTLISSTDLGAQGRGFARQTVTSSASTLASGWTAATSDDYVGQSVAFYEDDNLVTPESSSFESGTVGGWGGATAFGTYAASTPTNSATRAFVGTKSLLVTHPTSALGSLSAFDVVGLVNGQRYTYDLRVYVPTGSADVRLEALFIAATAFTSTKDAWVELQCDFAADSSLHTNICIIGADPSTAGQQVWIDVAKVTATNYLDGTVTATTTGTVGKVANATLAGTGTLSATATVGKVANATLAGTGALTGTSTMAATVNATAVATGTLAAASNMAATVNASLAGTGTLASTATVGLFGNATLAGTGTLSGTATTGKIANVTLAGTGTLTSTATVGVVGNATLAGTGTLSATATDGKVGNATLAGTGTLTSTATVGVIANATATATGTLSATASASGGGGGSLNGDAALVGTGTPTSTATVGVVANATLAGTGTLTATATDGKVANATLAATGTLTATATVGVIANATRTGTGTLAATGAVAAFAASTLAGTGTLTATAIVGTSSGSTITATATLTATGTAGQVVNATIVVTATLTATATVADGIPFEPAQRPRAVITSSISVAVITSRGGAATAELAERSTLQAVIGPNNGRATITSQELEAELV